MASPMPETVLFEISGQSPSPKRDWYHLAITPSDVTWSWWYISRCAAKPGQLTQPHRDFLDDRRLHNKVILIFGKKVLEHAQALCLPDRRERQGQTSRRTARDK